MNGCGHCDAMHSDWEKLTSELNGKIFDGVNVKIQDIECTSNEATCSGAGVEAFPTMILQKGLNSDAEKVSHNGGRDFETLKKFVMDNLQ